ncbi:P-loop NTPase fold protein [Larkinella rosea]|nr:P-loop NTPase fold protein [Larkinella rosea]
MNFQSQVFTALGSLFNQEADLLIIPRSDQGILSDSFRVGLDALNPDYLAEAQKPSTLGLVQLENRSEKDKPKVAYATTFSGSGKITEELILDLGRGIIDLAAQTNCKTVAVPLLGSGKGSLDPKLVYNALTLVFSQVSLPIQFTLVIYEIAHYETITGRKVSATVRQTGTNMVQKRTCTSLELALDILSRHRNYANNTGDQVTSDPAFSGDRQPLLHWFEALFRLLPVERVARLDGHDVIAGLAIIDDALRRHLLKNDFLRKLLEEMSPKLENLLEANELKQYQLKYPATVKVPFDEAVFLAQNEDVPLPAPPTASGLRKMLTNDAWATKDLLGYELYATAISGMIIEDNHQTNPPLTVAILAPWGQGKTTLMRYIEKNIRAKRKEVREKQLNEKTNPTEEERAELDELVENRLTEKRQQQGELSGQENDLLAEIAGRKTVEKANEKISDSFAENGKKRFNQITANIGNLLDWLKKTPADSAPIPFPTVWFNPWKHQNSEQVWAGMALSMINQLVEYLPGSEREKFWFQLNLKRVNSNVIKNRIYRNIVNEFLTSMTLGFVLISSVLFGGFITLGWWLSNGMTGGVLGGLVGFVLPVLGKFWESRRTVLSESLEKSFADIVTEPKYENRVGYFQEVETDLERVFSLLVSAQTPAVIFIDDLDRCSPDVTAEVIEAINQIINGSYSDKCYFVIGMDAKMVAASLDKKYSSLVEKLMDEKNRFGDIGYYFLDKFIQLPFVLPTLDDTVRSVLLNNLFDSSEKKELVNKVLKDNELEIIEAASKNASNLVPTEEVSELFKQNPEAGKRFIENRVVQKITDSAEIVNQVREFLPYLGSSPRVLKRFVNMFRFYYSYQELRKLKNEPAASPSALAKWLLLCVRCPQLVRFVQQERADKFVLSTKAGAKAARFDELVQDFHTVQLGGKRRKLQSADVIKWQETITALDVPNFEWLKDEEVLTILLYDHDGDGKLANAISCNVW